jgi:ArsR family transcriptional regulator, arsenate/arsenite/antimonite-responsive transcriptional repressor
MEINEYASLFKSLSEPVRLRILYLMLEEGELCVCDIVSALELSQSVVSRHLAYLRNGGLVSTRREGVWVYYAISKADTFITSLLAQFKDSSQNTAALSYDLQRLHSLSNDCCE